RHTRFSRDWSSDRVLFRSPRTAVMRRRSAMPSRRRFSASAGIRAGDGVLMALPHIPRKWGRKQVPGTLTQGALRKGILGERIGSESLTFGFSGFVHG